MNKRKKIVVFTGAGISAESGLKTFRDSDGLWENYRIEDVATPEAWRRNKSLVLDFYNERRRQLLNAQPNAAHLALVELEKLYEVVIITQNVDDLHERAGSKRVIHLHGELLKARSSLNENLVYEWRTDLKIGDTCELGSQLRPHVVWFGETVPKMQEAIKETLDADILLVIGTSLQVYPAASIVQYAPRNAEKYYIDPKADELSFYGVQAISKKAGEGVPELVKELMRI
ncbi:MAG: NAD-dependent deacylase [Chitinophagales bacterium]|nr:NAD-dependent deacylase [Chitinophagales bacterium]MDW8272753.1 NAD-dependent deacylase [Chitinophagales bacterium]